MKICISGISGFVGQNLSEYLKKDDVEIVPLNLRGSLTEDMLRYSDVVIHLAGKAHDLKKVSNAADFYAVNFQLTRELYDLFLRSGAKKFIFISSVKAVADRVDGVLTEDRVPEPQTHYGKSKLLAESYIQQQHLPEGKSYYILRPCMIHGPGNKGNLNLLYKIVSKNIPWPLGRFDNQRSFLSIENLSFVIREIIRCERMPSGIYHVADDIPLSSNNLVQIIASTLGIHVRILSLPKGLVRVMAKVGDALGLAFNSEGLDKLTENYVVSNKKLLGELGKPLPVQTVSGIIRTIQAFQKNKTEIKNSIK